MNRNTFKKAAILLTVMMLVFVFSPVRAFAATADNEAKIKIQVEKVVLGYEPAVPEKFVFQLKALDNAPMPESAVDGVVTTTILGEGTGTFPEITYTDARTYQYEVSEVKGTDLHYTYDCNKYKVTVQTIYVEREGGTQQLVANFSPYIDGQESKPSKISFINWYYAPPNTGTNTPYGFLWTLFGISCVGLIVLVYRSKKDNGSEKKAQ